MVFTGFSTVLTKILFAVAKTLYTGLCENSYVISSKCSYQWVDILLLLKTLTRLGSTVWMSLYMQVPASLIITSSLVYYSGSRSTTGSRTRSRALYVLSVASST